MKKVISFSLWGNLDIYNVGAVANAAAALEVYPKWICRFYVLEGAPAIQRLREFPNTEVVSLPDEPAYAKAFWRFLAASDRSVELAIFRDCDSRVGWRDRAAVDAWVESGRVAHIMRDIETHSGELMLSGMWGIRGGAILDMASLCRAWVSKNDVKNKQADEIFLRDVVWPRISSSVLSHGYAYKNGGPLPKQFPPHAPGRGEYVGMPIAPDARDIDLCKRNAPFRR